MWCPSPVATLCFGPGIDRKSSSLAWICPSEYILENSFKELLYSYVRILTGHESRESRNHHRYHQLLCR
ncbi:hypothetical protein VTN96DRAFT_2044 [Rasamsonia emersonii]